MVASITTSFKAAIGDLDTTAQCPVGTIREDNNRVYKYCLYSGTTSIAVGDFLCYVASAGATDTMTKVDGANTAVPAGVAPQAVGTGTALYGWVQIKGLATLSTALAGSPAAGDKMTTAGAAAPAVTKAATDNASCACIAFDVANKLVSVTCPH